MTDNIYLIDQWETKTKKELFNSSNNSPFRKCRRKSIIWPMKSCCIPLYREVKCLRNLPHHLRKGSNES